jgi:hypothetical protein
MRLFILSAVTMISVIAPSLATTLRYKSFDQLVEQASGIVEGTVARILSVKVAGGDFYTFVTLSDIKLHKGDYDAKTLTLRLRGGLVGEERHVIVGSPEFAAGQRVIAFVSDNGRSMVPLVGWEQGVFRVENERVVDSRGNPVIAIENSRVRKKARLSASIEVLDGAGPNKGRERVSSSLEAKGSAGKADDGSINPESAGAIAEPPMTYEAFVTVIGASVARAALAGTKPRTSRLVSADEAPPGGDRPAGTRRGASAPPFAAPQSSDGRVQLPVPIPTAPPTVE